jgi:hypothetical protein
MRVLTKALFGVLASLMLASCGGGGGGGNDSAFQPQGIRVTVSPASTSSTPFSLVGVTVRVTGANGAVLPDGTSVRLQVSPPGVGLVSAAVTADPAAPIPIGEAVTNTLSGGVANFRLHTRAAGSATITASVTDPNAPARTETGTATVAVAAGAPTDPRLVLQVQSLALPINPNLGANQAVFFGSPYISEVTLVQRRLDGSLVPGTGTGGGGGGADEFCNGGTGAGAAVGSGLNSLALWLPAEGIDDDGNIRLCRSVTLGINSGRSVFYAVALDQQGTSTLAASGTDPQTGEALQAVVEFRVSNGAPQLPGTVVIRVDPAPIYISTVNGNRSKQVEVDVRDGGGTLVPNPSAGVDNVRLEIVGGGQGGERLRGVNAAGSVVQGDNIQLRSGNGLANATFEAGTRSGAVTLRATSDRADNNVSNGIQDAVTSTRQFNVSDGQLFGLKIQTLSEAVSDAVAGPPGGNTSPTGTYRMLITARGVDRIGTPVPANTEIRFGLIDEPQANGQFTMSGVNGNPQENGTLFTGSGNFLTGPAGPGDTLLVIGENANDDRDLESARTVASVISNDQLTVTQPFNPNDVSGTSVDRGPVYPFVVGRARDGSITAQGVTDANGVASAVLTYPASQLGKRVYVWAQGQGTPVNGRPRLVSDVAEMLFAAAGPPAITANPTSLGGNRLGPVRVCVRDVSGTPVRGANLAFAFNAPATGSVNGVNAPGLTPPTGADGCITLNVLPNFVPGSTGPGELVLSLGGEEVTIEIVRAGVPVLSIGPNPVRAFVTLANQFQLAAIAVCANDGGGPIPGVQINVVCTPPTPASPTLLQPVLTVSFAGTTGQDGCTVGEVSYSNMIVQNGVAAIEARNSTCSLTTNAGLSGSVQLVGTRRCGDGLTPALVGCPP